MSCTDKKEKGNINWYVNVLCYQVPEEEKRKEKTVPDYKYDTPFRKVSKALVISWIFNAPSAIHGHLWTTQDALTLSRANIH